MDLCTMSKANPVGSASFFVSFVLIGTMIFLNLFIGVIMTGMDEVKAEMAVADELEKKGSTIDITDLEKKLVDMQAMITQLKKSDD
jgi:voltage-gated sodium channel